MSRAAKVQTTGLRERGSQKKERAEQMGVQRQTARLVRAECGLQPFLDLAPGSAATPTKASSGQRLNHQAANCPGLMGAKCCVEREAEQIDRHGQSRAVGGELATRKFSSGFRGIAEKCDASGARLWAVGAEEEVEAKRGAGGARCAERQKRTRDAKLETIARAWRHALR